MTLAHALNAAVEAYLSRYPGGTPTHVTLAQDDLLDLAPTPPTSGRFSSITVPAMEGPLLVLPRGPDADTQHRTVMGAEGTVTIARDGEGWVVEPQSPA